jgi:hypothetical protein
VSQPAESRTKTASTDAVLMHPENAADAGPADNGPPPESGEVRVEIDGEMVPWTPTAGPGDQPSARRQVQPGVGRPHTPASPVTAHTWGTVECLAFLDP